MNYYADGPRLPVLPHMSCSMRFIAQLLRHALFPRKSRVRWQPSASKLLRSALINVIAIASTWPTT